MEDKTKNNALNAFIALFLPHFADSSPRMPVPRGWAEPSRKAAFPPAIIKFTMVSKGNFSAAFGHGLATGSSAVWRIGFMPMSRLVAVLVVAITSSAPTVATEGAAATAPLQIISRGVPAYASAGDAAYANNAVYAQERWIPDCEWTVYSSPSWLAYDLSGVPATDRTKILVVWYGGGQAYDCSIIKGASYRMPGPYVLEGNTARGGTKSAPTTGWTTLVTGDVPQLYHSRQHVVQFAGYNWLRFRVLSENPNNYGGNLGTSIKLDVYNAAHGITDDFIVYGDSITQMTFFTNCVGPLVHQKLPAYNPIWEGGGIGFMTARDGAAKLLPKWLPLFPGRYVCLAYGTNDANLGRPAGDGDVSNFSNNYESMVKQILAVKKIPVVGTVIWAKDDGFRQRNLELFNAALKRLKGKYPQILDGPDLYGRFKGHLAWYQDDLHPSAEGREVLRKAWAQWALDKVYATRR
jgi:lysophospholipase L1-like esterase